MFFLQKYLFIIIFYLIFKSTLFAQEFNHQLTLEGNDNLSDFILRDINNHGKIVKKINLDYKFSKKFKNNFFSFNLSNGYKPKKFYLSELKIEREIKDGYKIALGKFHSQIHPYLNEKLSSGSLLRSNNAEPIPKISLSYKLTPFKKNLTLKLSLSHGWLDKNQFYSDAPFLHEKFIYLESKQKSFDIGMGFVHEAIWAGSITDINSQYYNISGGNGNQPDKLKDFIRIFLTADGPIMEGQSHANAIGSHLGIWDFFFIKKLKGGEVKLYYQHIFEDTSGLRFKNKTDGLWGAEIQSKGGNRFLAELINSSNCCIDPPYINDIYYFNHQYSGGWTYKGNTIGNVFLNLNTPDITINPSKFLHLGAEYRISQKSKLLILYNKNLKRGDFEYFISIKRKVFSNLFFDIYNYGNYSASSFGSSLSINF